MTSPRFLTMLIAGLLSLASIAPMYGAGALPPDSALQRAFAEASRMYHVPLPILLAVSYHESRWDDHGPAPSTSGGYGPMQLTDVPGSNDSALHTLALAARLTGIAPARLRSRVSSNVRGGAAVLALYARSRTGKLPKTLPGWYDAVCRYSGSRNSPQAQFFAHAVFVTLRTGMSRRTMNGQWVQLAPHRGLVMPHVVRSPRMAQDVSQAVECPAELGCQFVPAAYARNSATDATDYGNYDVANRPNDGLDVRYIVIHDTEGSYSAAINEFRNPQRYASANYVVRSTDGHITQMVPDQDIAWHAANYYVNMHAIGVEHEGVAVQGETWYTEQLYEESAALVAYLAARFKIPLDRSHILGHDEVPGVTPATQSSQHWDPGPFWDWAHYMDLVQGDAPASTEPAQGPIVTISPDMSSNEPPLTYCSPICRTLPPQPSNFVYVYTQPSLTAPLIADPALHSTGAGTTQANDWGDKAVNGQQFVRIARQGDWDEIDYGGRTGWINDPAAAPVTTPAGGILVTPRAGKRSIRVFGRAYPAVKAYPRWVPQSDVQKIVKLQYSILAGQKYVMTDQFRADVYWSPTQTQHAVIHGKTLYDQIYFNHRFAFVQDSDVSAVIGGSAR